MGKRAGSHHNRIYDYPLVCKFLWNDAIIFDCQIRNTAPSVNDALCYDSLGRAGGDTRRALPQSPLWGWSTGNGKSTSSSPRKNQEPQFCREEESVYQSNLNPLFELAGALVSELSRQRTIAVLSNLMLYLLAKLL